MCGVLRLIMVPKNTTANATQTTAIAMSIGHSSSAYSLEVVKPIGSEMAAATIIACHPQKVKAASFSANSRTWQVR